MIRTLINYDFGDNDDSVDGDINQNDDNDGDNISCHDYSGQDDGVGDSKTFLWRCS